MKPSTQTEGIFQFLGTETFYLLRRVTVSTSYATSSCIIPYISKMFKGHTLWYNFIDVINNT